MIGKDNELLHKIVTVYGERKKNKLGNKEIIILNSLSNYNYNVTTFCFELAGICEQKIKFVVKKIKK